MRVRPVDSARLLLIGASVIALFGCSDAAHAPPTTTPEPPKPAVSAGPEVKAKAFTAKLVGGDAHAGSEDAVELSVVPAAGYHINEEYPYKFKLDAPAKDVTYPKDVVTDVTRSAQLATMKIPFTASAPGTVRVSGTCSISVCNADQCVIEKVPMAADVTVAAGSPPAGKAQKLPSMRGAAIPGGVDMPVPDGFWASIVPEGRSLGAEAWASMPWIANLAKGASTGYPAADVEIQGVVIDGSIELRDDAKGGAVPQKLDPWTAFRAPGGAITMATLSDVPARVVLFVASPDKKPLATILPGAKPPPGRRPARTGGPRMKPIEVVDLQAREPYRWSKGAFEARVAWTTAGAAALDAVLFAPGAAMAEQRHDGAWECLFTLRGTGDVIVDGKPQKVAPGLATCVAPDTEHAWKPSGGEALVAIQFYAPAGAEQRFKTLAAEQVGAAADPTKRPAPAP